MAAPIIWLASYPKSGNTWLRTFLTNYQADSEQAADINNLTGDPYAVSRYEFDDLLGIASSDLTWEEINNYRPLFYELLAAECSAPFLIKVHDAYSLNRNNKALFPTQVTAAVIYIIRNPLDVALSFAHHNTTTLDNTIKLMGSDAASLCGSNERLNNQLPQKLLSWSNHVQSWLDQSHLSLHIVRYEDMLQQPAITFSKIVRFIGYKLDHHLLQKALDFSRFEKLQAQEAAQGFHHKPANANRFFRQGTAGDWQNQMNQQQVKRMIDDHYLVMQQFGYLSSAQDFASKLLTS